MWKTEREIKHSIRDLGIVNQQVEIWHLQLICSSADSTLKTQWFYFPSGLNYNIKSNIMCWCIFWGIFKGYMCWSMLWWEQNLVDCTPIVTGKALTQKHVRLNLLLGCVLKEMTNLRYCRVYWATCQHFWMIIWLQYAARILVETQIYLVSALQHWLEVC